MPSTTLTFDLVSKSAHPPIVCGLNEYVTIHLKPGSVGKSHDGSGYLVAPITSVNRLANAGFTWRYTVVVAESQLASGQTLSAADVYPKIACITQTDAALFAKIIANLGAPSNWEVVALAMPVSSGSAVNTYLFRRSTSWILQAAEIGIENLANAITVQLQATTAGGTVYSNVGGSVVISPPALSARRVFSPSITIPANAAVRAVLSTASGIYSAGATVDLHLFTQKA